MKTYFSTNHKNQYCSNHTFDLIIQQIVNNDDLKYILLLIYLEDELVPDTALQKFSIIEEQWGNLIGNKIYINNIIEKFFENKRLGILLAPCGIHGSDFGKSTSQKLHACMGLWCRKNVFIEMENLLAKLLEQNNHMPIMRFRDTFISKAQQMGYYTATIMKPSYASMAYTNMQEMLSQIQIHTKSRYEFNNFGNYLDGDMLLFCEKYPRIYVYGAGENGGRASKVIKSAGHFFSGFIVSDNQPYTKKKYDAPVYKLSTLKESDLCAGIVISVANKNAQNVILMQLREKGFKNIYLLDT